jgi:hypothetical protein
LKSEVIEISVNQSELKSSASDVDANEWKLIKQQDRDEEKQRRINSTKVEKKNQKIPGKAQKFFR